MAQAHAKDSAVVAVPKDPGYRARGPLSGAWERIGSVAPGWILTAANSVGWSLTIPLGAREDPG
jgi:hypothetical protein